jgi:hypothetical protein
MQSLKVISIGLHRTGSLSVKVALERLGLGPCYHGFEYVGRGAEDVDFWRRAIDASGHVDWDELFGQYQAAADWPMIFFWDKVVTAYPDAKVLLTERDPDDWFDSHVALFEFIERYDRENPPLPGTPIVHELIGAVFGERIRDRAYCIDVFEQHCARVRAQVPADRLLVYRVADGWDPLCNHLGVAPPDEPFPRVNSRAATPRNATLAATNGVQPTNAWQ